MIKIEFEHIWDVLLASSSEDPGLGEVLGRTRGGCPVSGFRFGHGGLRVSLLGGCHADEPVGPILLRRFVNLLSRLPETHVLIREFEWWIVPHINPDGAERNSGWQDPDPLLDKGYDPIGYLRSVVRELPGDDIEFGFPRGVEDERARPENRAVYDWWRSAKGPFHLHVSLHGMGFSGGPWFLIDEAWVDRTESLRDRCASLTKALGYSLHDVDRRGEKGFRRIGRGFCTRPSSLAMSDFFLGKGDEDTAALFRPSSMETMRSLGGDPLTLVSEMPLFITPGVGETLEPPDPVVAEWKERIDRWRVEVVANGDPNRIASEMFGSGLRPMPTGDQMRLQWALIAAGLEEVTAHDLT